MDENMITLTIGKQKNIALIAHDGKKKELIEWCRENADIFKDAFSMWNRNNSKNDHRPDRTAGAGI